MGLGWVEVGGKERLYAPTKHKDCCSAAFAIGRSFCNGEFGGRPAGCRNKGSGLCLRSPFRTRPLGKIGRAIIFSGLVSTAACQAVPTKSSDTYEMPACARPQPQSQRTFKVFFDQHKAVVTPRGLKIIQEFAKEFSIYSDLDVFIEAGTDTSEVLSRDHKLDLRRGEAIAQLLRQFCKPSDVRIHVVAMGTRDLLVPTPPRTPEPQNRGATLFTRGGEQVRPSVLQSECLSWLREHQCGPQVSDAQRAICLKVKSITGAFSPI